VLLSGAPRRWHLFRKLGLAITVAAATCFSASFVGGTVQARESLQATVALTELPKEAQHTERLIRSGGPFPYSKDGSVFGNRERLLPAQRRGYYREYTVRTPGSRDRGARRIVCGGRQPTAPDACFYTDDHYASFRRIVQ
jgi:ribonuclease T1